MISPRSNAELFGHAAPEALLAEAMASERLHHAWLLTGPPGIGKATLAFRFARRLLAGEPHDGSLALHEAHPVFRRVAAGSHADLLTVEREYDPKRKRLRGEIVVDDVRQVGDFLHRTAAEGGWRVVIVDGAEDLNRNAANALLKVLEEPPSRALLLLVCTAPGRLLPTIRSRTRRLAMTALAPPDVGRVLGRHRPELDATAIAAIAGLAEGSPGRALMLADAGGTGAAALVEQTLASLPAGIEQAHALADALGRNEDGFSSFMELLRAAVAAAVRAAGRNQADPAQARLLGTRPLADWVDVWHALGRLQDETDSLYLDKRQALVTGLGMLAG